MAREDDIATILSAAKGASASTSGGPAEDDLSTLAPPSLAHSLRASVSGFDATSPGRGEVTEPGSDTQRSPRRRAPQQGDTIGSFVVEKLLGRGAMGVVLLAHDPELDRRVAIKLLATNDHDPTGGVRLQREAQSAAGIAHPNVVAVHQVGTHEGQVYLVMEFVDGGTLREWLADEPRTTAQIIDAFVQAGRGLAAAHVLGLVHRDFKPDNVLIGRDGRVRVSDFGLVGRSGDSSLSASTLRSFDNVAARLTQTGAVMGTPAYMPVEQLAGDRVDARSDQFSFCVALYEGLWGRRPYAGDTLATIFAAIEAGRIEIPSDDDVSPAIRSAIFKGLATFPRDRHASMEALLDALAHATDRPRRRAPVIAASLALVAMGAGGAYLLGPASAPAVAAVDCDDATSAYGEAWNEHRRTAVIAAFSVKPTGAEMFAVLDEELLARREAWVAGHRDACLAHAQGRQTDATYAQRTTCLSARQAEADVFSALLMGEDDRLLDGALSSATTLLPIEECADVEALQAAPAPTEEQAVALAPLRRELTRARILLLAGRHQEVAALVEEQLPALRAADFDAELASGLEILARAQMQIAEYDKAEANLREALTLAARARAHGTEARATGTLIFIVAQGQGRPDEALGMLPAGRAAAARSSDPRALSYLESAVASLHVVRKDYGEAMTSLQRAIDTLEALDRPPPDELGNAYSNRADIKMRTGDMQGALADHERAVAVVEAGLGPNHPFYGAFAMHLGIALSNEGLHDRALEAHRRALAAWEASYGPDHRVGALAMHHIGLALHKMGELQAAAAAFDDGIARHGRAEGEDPYGMIGLVHSLADTRLQQGNFDAAWDAFTQARSIVLRTEGDDDPRVPNYDRALASVLQAQGKYRESLPHLEAARTKLVARHGPKHSEVAAVSTQLGGTYVDLGDCKTAKVHYANTLRIREDLALPADSDLADVLVGSALCDLDASNADAAAESLAHARTLTEGAKADALLLARMEFAEARLAGARGGTSRALASATAASERLGALGPVQAQRKAALDDWRRQHAKAP